MKKLITLLMIGMIMVTGCTSNNENDTDRKSNIVTGIEAKDLIDNNNAILIDVREKSEYDEGHIEGAINIPYATIAKNIDDISKDEYIIVYCRSGKRSSIASNSLIELGYKNVYDLGSIDNWE